MIFAVLVTWDDETAGGTTARREIARRLEGAGAPVRVAVSCRVDDEADIFTFGQGDLELARRLKSK